jgi:DNA-binding transcriptional LysR family regulator
MCNRKSFIHVQPFSGWRLRRDAVFGEKHDLDDYAEFRHLKYLLAIVEHKGLRAAAEALNITEPSLSRQAREFQQHYKLKLYRRSKTGRIEITRTGQALPIIFRDLLEARDEAIAALEAIERGEAETLRIGCTPFVDKKICERAAQLQGELVPASKIRLFRDNTAQLIKELLHDHLDVAIVSLPVTEDNLRVEIIRRDRLVVCLPAGHLFAKKAALSAADLTHNLTVFRRPSQHPEAHARLLELLGELGVWFEEQAHVSHPHEMLEAVKDGEGFALVREGTPMIDGVTTRPIIGVDWTFDTAVAFSRNPKSRIVPVIAKHLKKTFLHSVNPVTHKKGPASEKGTGRPSQQKNLFEAS